MRLVRLAGVFGAFSVVCLSGPLVGGIRAQGAPPAFQAYSKFDFVPGERIAAWEDFSQDAIGDFQAKWNPGPRAQNASINNAAGSKAHSEAEAIRG